VRLFVSLFLLFAGARVVFRQAELPKYITIIIFNKKLLAKKNKNFGQKFDQKFRSKISTKYLDQKVRPKSLTKMHNKKLDRDVVITNKTDFSTSGKFKISNGA